MKDQPAKNVMAMTSKGMPMTWSIYVFLTMNSSKSAEAKWLYSMFQRQPFDCLELS